FKLEGMYVGEVRHQRGYLACTSILVYMGEVLTELKLGNGTSLLIFVNIVSALPSSVGETIKTAQETDSYGGVSLFAAAFIAITMGVVYVQRDEGGKRREAGIN
ncbi:hypothetical protein CYMTET_22448, partial [Cymbomonas tetramitiformis]